MLEALNNLSEWCSDCAIYTEKVETSLRGIEQSTSLAGDKAVLKRQINLVTRGMEISQDFYMNVAQCCMHLIKYSDVTTFEKMKQNLMSVAVNNGDNRGQHNYAMVFLHCLKVQLHEIEDKISCQLINALHYEGATEITKVNTTIVTETGGENDSDETDFLTLAGITSSEESGCDQ